MTATDKLNSAARSMGWANWAEVISHNAPPHVINAVVMRAMGDEVVRVGKPEPALTWRPGARVRITSKRTWLKEGQEVYLYHERPVFNIRLWVCGITPEYNDLEAYVIAESDGVVVG